MRKPYQPSEAALAAFQINFKLITPEQGAPWLRAYDDALAMTPEDVMRLKEELAEYRKLIKAYDAQSNDHPDRIRLMLDFPKYYNAIKVVTP